MKLLSTVIGSALFTISISFAFASPCAPTKDETALVAKSFGDFDAEMKDLNAQATKAVNSDRLAVLQKMLVATRALQEMSWSPSKAYCDRAKATVNTLFNTISGSYRKDERAKLLFATEQIANSLGVALSQKQSSLVTATAKPLIEKALKALDEAVLAKSLDRISQAYDDLRLFANTALGKRFKVDEKLRAAEAAYNAISEAEAAGGGSKPQKK